MDKPFIYIAALRRTGSTMLCEALTELPYCLVFNEPNFDKHTAIIRPKEREVLSANGIDVDAFLRRWSGWRRRFVMRGFRSDLASRLGPVVQQLGVKEIFHQHWRRYRRAFPGIRIILTARDPRDIYISLRGRWIQGKAIWKGPFTPERVAADLNLEFRRQLDMHRSDQCLKMRYEELCTEPENIQRVKEFLNCDVPGLGGVGEFLSSDTARRNEYEIHGNKITNRRVFRWKDETDLRVLEEAHSTFELMPQFCDFWEYSR